MKKLNKYPIVMLSGVLDHAIETHGMVEAKHPIVVWGLLYKETDISYILQNWVYGGDLTEENNVTSAIVKHPGIKKKVLGWVAFK